MLLRFLFRLLAMLPLPVVHFFGAAAGRVAYAISAKLSARTLENLTRSQLVAPSQLARVASASVAHTGRTAFELSHAWLRPLNEIEAMISEVRGWEHVVAARGSSEQQRGIIFVTPHLGGYDIAGRYLGLRLPMTVLYREPKVKALEPLMKAGRDRGGAQTVPTGIAGVKGLLKALKAGRSIIVLPDQAPHGGDGVWAPFFGQPAFTMTLIARLAQSTGAAVLYFTGERLPQGRFRLHIQPPHAPFVDDKPIDAAIVNTMVERMIAICPEQYLWSYNRYKQPAGAPPAPELASSKSDAH
jgi:Kdo2-lipid IVA lauroyltransferase/acyltransferase